MCGLISYGLVLVCVQRQFDVDGAQQGKDVCLQENHQHLEQRECYRSDKGQPGQGGPTIQLPEEEVRGTEKQD